MLISTATAAFKFKCKKWLGTCFAFSLLMGSPVAWSLDQSGASSNTQNVYPHNLGDELPTYQGTMVRVGLKLMHYRKVPLSPGNSQMTYLPGEAIKKTLRARIDAPNHFYIDSYHIETIPLTWIRKSRSYTMRLSISQRPQRAQNGVERHLGYVDVKGTLRPQARRPSVYLLMGAASQTFFSDLREPFLKVVAGYGKVRSPYVASRAPHGKSVARNQVKGVKNSQLAQRNMVPRNRAQKNAPQAKKRRPLRRGGEPSYYGKARRSPQMQADQSLQRRGYRRVDVPPALRMSPAPQQNQKKPKAQQPQEPGSSSSQESSKKSRR